MKKFSITCMALFFLCFGVTGAANAIVIDFSGGTAYLGNGTSVTTDDDHTYFDVDYYVEDGFRIDFVNGNGIIGNYYQNYTGVGTNNAVIHAHPFYSIDIEFSREDGQAFDLNYVDMTSNTTVGGGAATGTELSYISSSTGTNMLLDPNDWGIEVLSNGVTPSDGIKRYWLSADFDGITSFTLWSDNAYCFGMDNFYIDEEAPPQVPEPGTLLLFGTGLAVLAGTRLKRRKQ